MIVTTHLDPIALFPLIPYHQKDHAGTESYNVDGLIPRAVRAIKQAVPDIVVIEPGACALWFSVKLKNF